MHEAIPAATLILLRDVPGARPEIPMVGRGAHLAFAANRTVFPGGRVDADDRRLATRAELIAGPLDLDPDDLAHRIAAIRETIEEIGLAPGLQGVRDQDMLDSLRTALRTGEALSAIIERLALRVDPHALHPFARWRPNHELVRRFDTRFYLARAPELGEAIADGVESSHCLWASAQQHLSTGTMIFPTARVLERIAVAADFTGAVALARLHPVETITPWVERRDGVDFLCIPEGIGYPVTAEPLELVDRALDPSKPSMTRAPG